MVKRRTFLKSTGTIGTVGILAGCIGGGGGGSDGKTTDGGGEGTSGGGTTSGGNGGTTSGGDGKAFVDNKLKFLMSPTEPQEQMRAQYKPIEERFKNYITSVDSVEMQYARNYAATLTALSSGTADVAETGPFAAALGVKADKADVILQRFGYGSWTYSSVIVTTKEKYESGEVTSLKDLKGKRIALADALSASGSLYPLTMLKEAGLSIPKAPGTPAGADFQPTWSSHGTAFNTLKQGNAAAAGVGRFITVSDKDKNGDGERDYKDGIVEIARRNDIPRAPIVVSPQLSSSEKEKVTKAFTEGPAKMYKGADGKGDTEDDLWFSKVRKADASTYDPVVKAAEKLGYGEDIFR